MHQKTNKPIILNIATASRVDKNTSEYIQKKIISKLGILYLQRLLKIVCIDMLKTIVVCDIA